MENFENWRKKRHSREVLLWHFFAKKTAAESHRLLVEVYGEHSLSQRQCFEWFHRFKSGDFDIKDKERPGQLKKFEDEELETLLDEDSCQTLNELATSLNVDISTISRRLKTLGFVHKVGHWVPHELRERDVERRFCMSEMLLARNRKKAFLHRMITGDEKWIHYDNPKRKSAYVRRGQAGPSTPKLNIHAAKVMLCIWWDQSGVIHYELLKPGQTVTGDLYRQQLIRLNAAIQKNRPHYATRHEAIIFHDDNARPHRAQGPTNYVRNIGWEPLPHPPYSPDLAPSDYHLFRSMQNKLTGVRFTSVQEIENWLKTFLASKSPQFFWDGIHHLPQRWQQVVLSDGQYFE